MNSLKKIGLFLVASVMLGNIASAESNNTRNTRLNKERTAIEKAATPPIQIKILYSGDDCLAYNTEKKTLVKAKNTPEKMIANNCVGKLTFDFTLQFAPGTLNIHSTKGFRILVADGKYLGFNNGMLAITTDSSYFWYTSQIITFPTEKYSGVDGLKHYIFGSSSWLLAENTSGWVTPTTTKCLQTLAKPYETVKWYNQ